jgi:hypothetical protein
MLHGYTLTVTFPPMHPGTPKLGPLKVKCRQKIDVLQHSTSKDPSYGLNPRCKRGSNPKQTIKLASVS